MDPTLRLQKRPTNGGNAVLDVSSVLPTVAFWSTFPSIPTACVSQPKALVSNERRHVAITTSTHLGRIDRQLQRRKEAERYSGTGRERYGRGIRRV